MLSPAPKEYIKEIPNEGRPAGPGTVFLVELPLWYMELPEEECEELGLGERKVKVKIKIKTI